MRFIILYIVPFILLANPSLGQAWSSTQLRLLDQQSVLVAEPLADRLLVIGRLGLATTRTAVALDSQGHILAPHLAGIDSSETPYLLYHPNGTRTELTILDEKPKQALALLKLESGFQGIDNLKTATIGEHLVVVPSLSPIAHLGERPGIAINLLKSAPTESSRRLQLERTVSLPGTPVFDFNGSLLGTTLRNRRGTSELLFIERTITDLTGLSDLLDPPGSASFFRPQFPQAPLLTKEQVAELPRGSLTENLFRKGQDILPDPLPCVLIVNEGAPLTTSVIGTVIREDGLILTKASELGPKLQVGLDGQRFPAVLLATDEKSDLALVATQATGLPVIEWSRELPPSGATLWSPTLLRPYTEEVLAEGSLTFGNLIGILKENTPTLQATSKVTSLGFVTEQLQDGLRIVAPNEESPSTNRDLQPGDLIYQLESQKIETRAQLTALLDRSEVGQTVSVKAKRDEEEIATQLTLVAPPLRPSPTGLDLTSGLPVIPSIRRGPFPDVLVYSNSLNAWDCGSPVFDIRGRALGINIAVTTSGRAYILALPEIEKALQRLLKQSRIF